MKKKKVKVTALILIGLLTLFLTGCVEIFQFISIKNGKVHMALKYTIQKSIMEMGASFSDEEVDYSEFTDIGEEAFENLQGLSGKVTSIETSLDIGAQIEIDGNLKEIESIVGDSPEYVPIKEGDIYKITIPSLQTDEVEDDESEGFAAAFLSGAKYRLLIELEGDLKNISGARFRIGDIEDVETDDFLINVYGNSMLIEFPMIVVFMGNEDVVIELY